MNRKLLKELDAHRFRIETESGVHRIYDMQPVEGEKNPLDSTGPLGEQIQKDRAIVADSSQSMPTRLAALNRLNSASWTSKK